MNVPTVILQYVLNAGISKITIAPLTHDPPLPLLDRLYSPLLCSRYSSPARPLPFSLPHPTMTDDIERDQPECDERRRDDEDDLTLHDWPHFLAIQEAEQS